MAVVLAGGLSVALPAMAHPNHDEDELKDHMAQMLREIGKPCAGVIEVEETSSTYLITCEVDQGGQASQVVYEIAKRR